ncbi:cation diffusion facilitator family transporter [Archaeoglobus profundus]|uniref:Cation diffusion facilitator family transporter n=1 Tax=Archaeoglobus profundus (strain DSM 5631 / JCM 9629 / NBRC 100127 / Av18) TaxID=572546 RepID=D2RGZ5_ARCPA|nr:cation diffusion facilitator family transporter [Archaeoglobus profundus]ADB57570.1 cation diffusion facilitator family transporter [Archaeoglobus profundus DSM 5631]
MHLHDRYLSFNRKVKVAFAVYTIIAILKLVCYFLTGFLVMFAEFLHNLVDITIFSTIVYTRKLSEKPPDSTHPFGHGLAQNVGSVVISVVFVTVIALELVREGIERILHPYTGHFPELAITVLIFSLVASSILYVIFGSEIVAERATRAELYNDILSNVGALAGILLTSVGYPRADGFLTIFIAFLICRNGYRLFKENVTYLLGKSPDEEVYVKIKEITESFPEVLDVHDIIAIYTGENSLHVDMHVTVRGDMKVKEADELTKRIAKKLMENIPEISYVLIHVCAERGEIVKSTSNNVMRKVYDM